MIAETSRLAYQTLVLPTLGARQMAVFKKLAEKTNWTNAELAEALYWPINTITPRVNELVKMGYVRHAETRDCKMTGHKAKAWEIVPKEAYQQELF